MQSQKNIAVLGATGSIGSQTLDIIAAHPERYRATVLTAGTRVDRLVELARRFRPRLAVIAREELYGELRRGLQGCGVECAAGAEALAACVEAPDIDTVLTATVGYSGLAPTIRAIRAGRDIALANKETLVVAGELITGLLASSSSRVFPVDSEHSAIAQCLRGEDPATVRRLIITASGGPFRTWTAERMLTARAADALNHPNWSMGAKITVDSATMMNKAFEIIEARYLFGIDAGRIKALVHPQSIVHSMVEFTDGSVKAHLGATDMRIPIQYALSWPDRWPSPAEAVDFRTMGSLDLAAPDLERFPCLSLAIQAGTRGGTLPCAMNAANEVAVAAFLEGACGFLDIPACVQHVMESHDAAPVQSFEQLVEADEDSRRRAEAFLRVKR